MKNHRSNSETGFAPESTTHNTSVSEPSAKVFAEQHYTVEEIAQMWKLSKDSVRRLFKDESGVLVLSPQNRKGKRSYSTVRIPSSVLERVHKKLSIVTVMTK